MSLFSLEGKTALVTGCKRGIGFAMAEALAEAGANILGVSASLELEGSKIEKRVKEIGKEFKAYQCDFSDRKALYAFIEKVKAENPQIDILVNNAGTILRAPAAEHSDEYWDKVIEVNQNAQFILTREIGKEMLKRGHDPKYMKTLIFKPFGCVFQGPWGPVTEVTGPVVRSPRTQEFRYILIGANYQKR